MDKVSERGGGDNAADDEGHSNVERGEMCIRNENSSSLSLFPPPSPTASLIFMAGYK
jgi:hypothetical protein